MSEWVQGCLILFGIVLGCVMFVFLLLLPLIILTAWSWGWDWGCVWHECVEVQPR